MGWRRIRVGQYQKAVRLLEPLAELGRTPVLLILGFMYENGNGLPATMRAGMDGLALQPHKEMPNANNWKQLLPKP